MSWARKRADKREARKDLEREFRDQLLRWLKDPVSFVLEAFVWTDAEKEAFPKLISTWQRDGLEALGRGEKRLAVRSGHGVGKTTWLAWVILWYQLTHIPNKCPVTANREDQLTDVVWAELKKWHRRLRPALGHLLDVTNDRISWKKSPAEGFAVARTARKEAPEAFQGFHAKHLLFVADEASGVHNAIFEVGLGAMSTPGAVTLLVGNPTRASGYFFDAFGRNAERWWTRKVSCMEVLEEGCPWISPDYPQEIIDIYGEESNVYRIRVLGEFPTSDEDAVIPRQWIADSIGRDIGVTGDEIWGVDVARYGDDRSALAKRKGNSQPEPVTYWRHQDTMTTAGMVKLEYDTVREKPASICVDVIGMGAAVADRLREQGLPVVDVNVAEAAPGSERFMRLRDELWWRAREWFHTKDCVITDDETLIAELGDVHYEVLSGGKIKVESKDDMKKRGVRSPDGADAFCLTFADGSGRPTSWGADLDYTIYYPKEAFA